MHLTVTAITSCWGSLITFFEMPFLHISVRFLFPPALMGSDIKSLPLLPTVREFSSTNILKVFLRLAGKHVPGTGTQRTDFSTPFPFFFPDQQGATVFPRDSFLCKEINYNIEWQEMKVIALTFLFAYEDGVQMLQSFPYSGGKSQHPKNKFLHVCFLLAA